MVNFANKRYVYLDEYVVLSPYAEVCIGIEDTYGDLCTFINAKNRYDQILMAALIGMNGIMIAFVCYMVFVTHAMPLGYIMACIILIAISIFIAISKGLFRGWDVVTALLDM